MHCPHAKERPAGYYCDGGRHAGRVVSPGICSLCLAAPVEKTKSAKPAPRKPCRSCGGLR